jgi:hypothetical protein
MQIRFSPTRSDETLALRRAGDTLAVNGTAFDFALLPEGARLPASATGCPWLTGEVTRQNGELHLTLILPHGPEAPEAVLFPAPIQPEDGPVTAPGLAEPPETAAPGQIDWSQMVTPETEAAAALAEWRATREVSKLDLVLAMAGAGLISPASAIAAAAGSIPTEFEPVVAAMPQPQQTEARIRWAGAATIPRLSPLILAVQAATGIGDTETDALFGWGRA